MTVTITVLATTPRIHEQQAIGLKSKKQSADCYLTTGVSRAAIFGPSVLGCENRPSQSGKVLQSGTEFSQCIKQILSTVK